MKFEFDDVNAVQMCADMLILRKEFSVNMILEVIALTYSNAALAAIFA